MPAIMLRILRFPLTLMVLGFIAFNILYALTGVGASMMRMHGMSNTPVQMLFVLAMAVLGIALYRLFQRYVEGRADTDYTRPGAWAEGGRGLLFGFVLFSAVVFAVWALGDLHFLGVRHGLGGLWVVLAVSIASGVYEEMVFRGLIFRHLETMLGTWAALALTSAFFGLAHIANPNATWFAAFAIAVEAGLMLGAAYMLTRRLWLASGLHAAWNFTQGWVYSIPISGGKPPEGLLLTSRTGPELITGGGFGLEASEVALIGATLAGLVLLRMAIAKNGVVAPMWMRKPA